MRPLADSAVVLGSALVVALFAGCAPRRPVPVQPPCAYLVCHEAGLTADECVSLMRGEQALREMGITVERAEP